MLRYIRENNNLGLKYYADMNDALVSDLLIKYSIKTENQLIDFSDSSWHFIQKLSEVQDHKSYFVKMCQLTIAHMSQNHFLNQVQKAITIHHATQ